jgi:hypothetical protein
LTSYRASLSLYVMVVMMMMVVMIVLPESERRTCERHQ